MHQCLGVRVQPFPSGPTRAHCCMNWLSDLIKYMKMHSFLLYFFYEVRQPALRKEHIHPNRIRSNQLLQTVK